jgi:predicted DNA binding CopG/RHH family protein
MADQVSQLLKQEAEYAEAHKDAPPRDGTVVTHRGQRTKVFSIRLSDSELAALEVAASAVGVPPSTLARQWIAERLVSEHEPADLQEIATALATFSRRLASL